MAKKALEQSLAQISLVRTTVDRYTALLRDTRRWWPVLIPFLIWRGKKTYDKELRAAIAEALEESRLAADAARAAAADAKGIGGKPAGDKKAEAKQAKAAAKAEAKRAKETARAEARQAKEAKKSKQGD